MKKDNMQHTDYQEASSPVPDDVLVGDKRDPRGGQTRPSWGTNETLVGDKRESLFSCFRFLPILLLLALLLPEGLRAQRQLPDSARQTRFVTRAVTYGVGYSNIFDTYLSPQEYRGIEVRVARETMRMTRWADGRLSLQNFLQTNASYTHNHVDNNNTFYGLVNWNIGLHYHIPLAPNFRLLAGGLADLNGGFVYNLRNGNNPASARAYINIDASVMAVWDVRIRNYPLTLRYQANLPLAGVMFSPHYGQSYYEIFSLGNGGGVVKFTSLHNQPSLRQMLTVDFPVRRTKMRVSYLCDLQQAKLNGIRSHAYGHAFMVGFVKEFYVLK